MTRPFHSLLAFACALVLLTDVAAAQRTSAAQALRAAADTADVDGDLRKAIAQYQEIVERFGTDRAAVATALLRMAEAHQKLGDSQARGVLERVIREYADQSDVVTAARAQLALLQSSVAPATRPIVRVLGTRTEFGANMVSAGGRYVSLTDSTGNLSVRDLVTGTTRRLTTGADWWNQYSSVSVVSPDNRQVAYGWYVHNENRVDVRVISLTDPSPTPLVALQADLNDGPYGIQWMPDGKQLQIIRRLRDRTSQIGTVTLETQSFRSVKSLEWRSPNLLSLSPDGRYLAYDVPAVEAGAPRDIMVLATDGSSESAVVKNPGNDAFPVWSPDGSSLLFLSDRSGRNDLWLVPMTGGRAAGPAVMIRADVGPISLLGLTRNGTLYYSETSTVRQNLFFADLEDMRATRTPVAATERMVDSNLGSTWSRDGEYIAYYSFRQVSADVRPGVLVIRSTRTGEERTVPLPARVVSRFGAGPKWFPDGRSVLVELGDAQGAGFGFYRMAIDTGNVVLLTSLRRDVSSYDLSSNGREIYYALDYGEDQRLMRFSIETRETTEISNSAGDAGREVVSLAVSPDGRQLAVTLIGGFIEVMPATGGPSRLLFSPGEREMGTGALRQGLTWSPDQRHVVFARGDASLWRVPVADGQAERVGLERVKSPAFSPDGRRLVFVSPDPPGSTVAEATRVMSLENFLPSAAR